MYRDTTSSSMTQSSTQAADVRWVENAWYQVAWCHELGVEGGLERTVLGRPLFVMRDRTE